MIGHKNVFVTMNSLIRLSEYGIWTLFINLVWYILLQIFVLKLTLRDKFYCNTTPGQVFDRNNKR